MGTSAWHPWTRQEHSQEQPGAEAWRPTAILGATAAEIPHVWQQWRTFAFLPSLEALLKAIGWRKMRTKHWTMWGSLWSWRQTTRSRTQHLSIWGAHWSW